MKALRDKEPSLEFQGVGGPQMRPYFSRCLEPSENFHMMGFSAILCALPRLYKTLKRLVREIIAENPDTVITIDFPDFNLLLAKMLRKKGYQGRLIHYISPSVWAWRGGRVKSMAKTFDRLLTIFPFEPAYFEESGLKTVYVGNPTYEKIREVEGPSSREELIAIFPGSRLSVIRANLPAQLEAARATGLKIAISLANPEARSLMPLDVEIVPESERFTLMKRARLAIATSGTITLELALMAVPTIATYQLSRFNFFLAYHLFRIRRDFYVMPNILLKRMLIPEIIYRLDIPVITEALKTVNQTAADQGAQALKTLLQNHHTSLRAAEDILHA